MHQGIIGINIFHDCRSEESLGVIRLSAEDYVTFGSVEEGLDTRQMGGRHYAGIGVGFWSAIGEEGVMAVGSVDLSVLNIFMGVRFNARFLQRCNELILKVSGDENIVRGNTNLIAELWVSKVAPAPFRSSTYLASVYDLAPHDTLCHYLQVAVGINDRRALSSQLNNGISKLQ